MPIAQHHRVSSLRYTTIASLLFFSLSSPARASELVGGTGAGGAGSAWEGDAALWSSLRLGWRLEDVVAPTFVGRLGWAAVDDRMLTLLTVGVQGWARVGTTRPWVRLALAHQHEESLAAVQQEPLGAVAGVGVGIRHRAGAEGALGLDVPIREWPRAELVFGGEVYADWFPDPRGPEWYLGGGLTLGVFYRL